MIGIPLLMRARVISAHIMRAREGSACLHASAWFRRGHRDYYSTTCTSPRGQRTYNASSTTCTSPTGQRTYNASPRGQRIMREQAKDTKTPLDYHDSCIASKAAWTSERTWNILACASGEKASVVVLRSDSDGSRDCWGFCREGFAACHSLGLIQKPST